MCREGSKAIFTNGCFDILHTGHIKLLRKAKSFGNNLILAINSDESVKRLKGSERPINNQYERAELLSTLEFVDYITIFDEDDPCKIISELKPHIHVKGGDYNPLDYNQMPEAKIINEYGGIIKIINLIEGKSTSQIIEKIKQLNN